jgi:hypothetical protein
MTIRAQEGDTIAGLDLRIEQRPTETARSVCKLSVAKAIFSADNGRFVGELLLRVTQKTDRSERYIHKKFAR